MEVIGQIHNYSDREEKSIPTCGLTWASKLYHPAEVGYHDFNLNGVTLSKEQDLDDMSYKKFADQWGEVRGEPKSRRSSLDSASPRAAARGRELKIMATVRELGKRPVAAKDGGEGERLRD